MNSSKYKDKQITELSESRAHNFLDDESDEEEGSPSFSFRPTQSSQLHNNALDGSHVRGWSSLDQIDSKRSSAEKVGAFRTVSMISEMDHRMKDHVDVLLHPMECLSARVSQMESRTRLMENSIDDLKELIKYNHGKSDAKLRELENILIEVQDGIQDLRDKQEIAEVKLRLETLRVSKDDVQLGTQNSTAKSSLGKEASLAASQQAHLPPPVSAAGPQQLPTLTYNVTSLPFQNHPITPAAAPPQMSTQLVQQVIPSVPVQESYHPLTMKSPETAHMQYHASPAGQPHPSSYTQQSYQAPHPIPLSLPSSQIPHVHSSFSAVNPQFHSPSSHHPNEVPYLPSYVVHKSSQPPGRSLPTQQENLGSAQRLHHHLLNQQYYDSSFSSSQAQAPQPQEPANINDFYSYGASPGYGSSSVVKSSQHQSSPPVPGGERSYSHLPTARILPHAIPTASSVDTGSGSSRNGNSVPFDDVVDNVVDNVVAMGFRRDLVRATVKRLTENGKSVDLNTVLDKLMNNG